MLFTHISTLTTLLAVASATETHGGYDYEVRFSATAAPESTDIKDCYETAAAAEAADRLRTEIESTGIAKDCLAFGAGGGDDTPTDVYSLKDCITAADGGEANFFALLADDIEQANTFWEKVVAESTTDRSRWVPARVYVRAYFDGDLDATAFATWTQSAAADAANSHANPEHYYKYTTVTGPASQRSEIFEGWGGVLSTLGTKRTNFTVPEYTVPTFGTDEYPAGWAIDDAAFPLAFQRIGPKQLTSGSSSGGVTFGALHIAVRDFAADEGDTGKAGIEIYAAVWYPPWDGAGEAADGAEFRGNYLADEAHHMVVEVVNLTLRAREDCSTGLCVPPS